MDELSLLDSIKQFMIFAHSDPADASHLRRQMLFLHLRQSRDRSGVDLRCCTAESFRNELPTAQHDLGMPDGAMSAASDGNEDGRDAALLQGAVNGLGVEVSDPLVLRAVKGDEGRIISADISHR